MECSEGEFIPKPSRVSGTELGLADGAAPLIDISLKGGSDRC